MRAFVVTERIFERFPFLNQLRYVLARRWFASRRARMRAFWHYIVRRYAYELCGRCGRPVARAFADGAYWQTDDGLWAAVNGGPYGVMCPGCFTSAALALGRPVHWEAVEGV